MFLLLTSFCFCLLQVSECGPLQLFKYLTRTKVKEFVSYNKKLDPAYLKYLYQFMWVGMVL